MGAITTRSITGRTGCLRRVATSLVLAVGLVTYLVMGATAASASCARPPTIEESMARADLVFVGIAVEVTNSSRWATFAVEDIWKGQVDGDRAEVRGGAREGVGTSVDRTYLLDTRYLVFASAAPTEPQQLGLYGKGVRWTDNNCSSTQPYTASLRESRPPTARTVGVPPAEPAIERPLAAVPRSAGRAGDRGPFDPAWPFALALAVAGVGGAGAVGIRIRRRQADSTRS